MPKYRIFASVGWIHNSKVDLGEIEAETEEEAQDEAFAAACERLDCWAEEVETASDASKAS